MANPKSSTGRLDVFTRLIVDRTQQFENVPKGYKGSLYLEISPRTFSVVVRTGTRLNQLRFSIGDTSFTDKQMAELQHKHDLIKNNESSELSDNLEN